MTMLVSLATAGLAVYLLAELGWLSPRRPWERATGWDAIAPEDRAPLSPQLGEGPEIHWLGHSGFRIRWHGVTLLLDPITARRCTVARRALEVPADPGAADAVLLTHGHFDHLNTHTLRQLRGIARFVVPAGSESYLDPVRGDTPVTGLKLGESLRIGELEVMAVPAAHNGGRLHPWKSKRIAVGYVIRDGREALYAAGDTSAANDFESLRDRYHPRWAILPIGAFAPRFPLKIHHLSPEEAVWAAKQLGVDLVVPCHFGTYRLSFDRVSTALPRFARAARATGQRWIMPILWRGDA